MVQISQVKQIKQNVNRGGDDLEEEKFLKVSEVSERFRISQNAIINKLRDGKIKGVKIGGTWRVFADQFKEATE